VVNSAVVITKNKIPNLIISNPRSNNTLRDQGYPKPRLFFTSITITRIYKQVFKVKFFIAVDFLNG